MNKMAVVGPWGNADGESWRYKAEGKISKISIGHGECIDWVSFSSLDDNGNLHHSDRYGGSGGRPSKVDIDIEVEELNGITGTIGCFNSKKVITSLTFCTNVNSFGPFGKVTGTQFSLPVSKATFAGFYGRSSNYLNAIGVFLKPT